MKLGQHAACFGTKVSVTGMQSAHTDDKTSVEAWDTCDDLHEQGMLQQCWVDKQPSQL